MKKLVLGVSLVVVCALTLAAAVALGGDNGRFRATLIGYEEVPAESTPGNGTFRARVVDNEIHYVLHYEDFEAIEGNTLFAHIHFGQFSVNGGVSAFLCGGSDKPPCPPLEGTITGVIDSTDVIGPTGQGIEAGSMAELLRAMRSRVTYANIHTDRSPGGVIRGQIRRGGGDDDD